jgi:predicted dehydrogenase
MESLRLALIGCGKIAHRHALNLRADPRAVWSVVYDPKPTAAEAFRNAYAPAAIVAPELDAALEHPLDGVVVCSPNADHYAQTCRALDRGLHVLCEKPLALDRGQIEDVIDRTARSGRIVSMAHQRRYFARYVAARRELTANRPLYGPLREIHLFLSENWSQSIVGTWRNDPAQNFGYFGDAGIHLVDVVEFVAGVQAERLYAVSDRRNRQVEIVTRVLAEMTGGVGLSAHFVGDAQELREDVHFHGTDADLLLRDNKLWRSSDGRCDQLAEVPAEASPIGAFLDAITTGRPTVSPPEVALPILAWNTAVMRSLHAGSWVDV